MLDENKKQQIFEALQGITYLDWMTDYFGKKPDNLSLSQTLGVMKKYSGAGVLTQTMEQELIEKVIVTDPEHVEIVWKFKDEVRNFIGM